MLILEWRRAMNKSTYKPFLFPPVTKQNILQGTGNLFSAGHNPFHAATSLKKFNDRIFFKDWFIAVWCTNVYMNFH